jgi:hypothetical protein
MPGRGKIQEEYLHPDRKVKDISRELNKETGLSSRTWKHLEDIILDTPKNTDRAHLSTEKAGFKKTAKEELPIEYNYPYDDSDVLLPDLERIPRDLRL